MGMKTVYKHIVATAAMLFFVVGSTFAQIEIREVVSFGGADDKVTVNGTFITYEGCDANLGYGLSVGLRNPTNPTEFFNSNVVNISHPLTLGTDYSFISLPTGFMLMPIGGGYPTNTAVQFQIDVVGAANPMNTMTVMVSLTLQNAPVSTVSVVGGASTILCEGQYVDLEADGNFTIYQWSKGGEIITENGDSKRYRASKKGAYTLKVGNSLSCLSYSSAPINVVVNDNPTVSLTIDPVCDGGSLQLEATTSASSYTYEWSGKGITPTPQVAPSPYVIPNASHDAHSGSYSVKVTDANGCEATDTKSIKVDDPMNAGTISIDKLEVCKGEPVELILVSDLVASGGHGAETYQWQMQPSGEGWTDIPSGDVIELGTITLTLNKTTNFRRMFKNDCAPVGIPSNEVTVTVVAPAVLDPGGPYTVCPGQTVTLHGSIVSGATKGTWKGGKGTWENKTTLDGATYTPDKSEYGKTIQLTLATTNAGSPCGNQSVKVDLVVAEEITLSFADEEVCINDAPFTPSVSANVAGGTGTLVTVDFDVNNPFDPAAYVGAGPQRFKYQYTAGGCTAEEEFTITVTNPQVFAITNISPETYCASGTGVTINLDGSESGLTYTVYKDGNPTTHETTGTGSAISISGVKDGNGSYTIRATDANGCWIDMASSVMLTEVSDIAGNDIAADQTICSGGPATLITGSTPTGGNGTYIYQWQSSPDGTSWTDISDANSQNYDPGKVSEKTYYQRYVTSGACDNTSTPVTISVTTPIQNNTIGADQTICYGAVPSGFTGTVATSSGGTVSYIWYETPDGTTLGTMVGSDQNLQLTTPLTATTQYIRVASDGGACPDDVSTPITVTVAAELKVNIINPQEPKCGGGSDGSLEADASGGLGDYTYTWTGDKTGTGKTFTGLKAGSYTVTVTASGCDASTTVTDNYTLGEPTLVHGSATPKHITSCFGYAEGEISVTASGGTGPYIFTLGAEVQSGTSANFTDLTAGDHTIYIEDANGCTDTATATINQPGELLMGTPDLVPPSCVGQADGQITVNAMGGTGALTYTLNGGAPTPVGTATTGLAADIYNIVVTDVNGCSITGSETLADPDPVSLNPSPIPVTGCPGSPTGGIALSITGGTGPYEYYSDQLGSTWTAVPAGNEITGLAAGNYTIKVRDANGCESMEKTVTVTELNALDFTLAANSVKCANSKDGEIVISDVKGGAGSGYKFTIAGAKTTNVHDGTVEYAWPDDFHGSKFENLEPDTYTLTLSDGVCNSLPKSVTIDAPPAISLNIDEEGLVQCPTPPHSYVTFTATGGTGDLTYHISGAMTKSGKVDKIPMTVDGLKTGSYQIEITDKECRSEKKDFKIDPGNVLRWVGSPIPGNVTCNGLDNGSVEVTIDGGIGPFTARLVPVGPDPTRTETALSTPAVITFSNLKPGRYQLAIKDEGNLQTCVLNWGDQIVISEPKPIAIEPLGSGSSVTDISCRDANDAVISIVATGGTGELKVNLFKNNVWQKMIPGSPAVFDGLDAGDYRVEVSDDNTCSPAIISGINITNPTEVVFDVPLSGIKNLQCAGDGSGKIVINGIGGGSGTGYAYSLDDGITYVDIADPTGDVLINGLSAGHYDVLVRDGNRCPALASFPVDLGQPDSLKIALTFDDGGLCSTDGNVVATAQYGTAPYEYSFDKGLTWDANNIGPKVSTGRYTVMLRDKNGCSAKDSIDIETPTDVVIVTDLYVVNQPSCEDVGRLYIEAEGGRKPLNYKLYKDGGYVRTQYDDGYFTVTDAGKYQVVVTDAFDCFGKTSVEVTIDAYSKVGIVLPLGITDVLCGGKATGELTVTATGGYTGDIFYILKNDRLNYSESNTTGVFDKLHANDYYYIIANDGDKCADTVHFSINANDTLEFVTPIKFKHETMLGQSDGEIDAVAKGGVPPYNYWLEMSGTIVRPAQSTGKFTGLKAGTYQVIVEDAVSCYDTAEIVLDGVSAYTISHHVSCNGANDGWFELIIHGNPKTGPGNPYEIYGYAANNPAIEFTDDDFTQINDTLFYLTKRLPADIYFFTIGDEFSGTNFQTDLYEPKLLIAAKTNEKAPKCATGGFGEVDFDVSGGAMDDGKTPIPQVLYTPTYVIKWVNTTTGESGQKESTTPGTITVDGLNPGVIEFIATTENGCNETLFTVDFPLINPITVDVSVLQESSYGAGNGLIEANATGDNPIVTYHLLDKDENLVATSAIGLFSNVSEGKYVVKAEDDLTCPGYSDTIYIRGTDVVVDDITPATCFGENQGAFKFHIEHGFPRFKSVSVADASGNTVAIAPEMALYSCNEPIAAENLLAGDYTITIVDSLNNTITHTVTIGEPDKLIIDATLTAPDCASNGSIALTVVGGVAPYTMEWAIDEGALETLSSSTIDIVQGGTYRVVVTDANNCTAEWSQYVAPAESITLALEEVSNPTCFGGDNGRIAVEAANDGSSMYQYLLEKDGILINITDNGVFENLSKGDYKVVVQNINTGCSQSFSYTLVDGAEAINIAFDGFTGKLNCPSDADGYATAVVTGGSGSYTYVWPQLGESTSSVSGLTPGTYEVIVADDLGCTATASYTIDGPKPFVFDKATRTEAKCRNSAIPANLGGKLSVGLVEGGTAPYSFYLVDETNHSIREGQPNFTGLGAGIYEVWVEDANGCRDMYYDTVLISPINDFEIGAMDTTVCFTNEVELKANVILGDVYSGQPLKYSWWSEANAANVSPDATGETYPLEGLDVNVYRYKLRVSQEGGDRCYVEKWFDVGVYPKIDIHVPLYVSSVQNDTILSILFNQEYNVDVSTSTFDYNTSFEWKPSGVFTRGNSWNSSIFMTPEKYEELKQTYPHRFKTLRDPQTKRDGDFFLVDVVATTDVGCQDSLTLYTKIVNKLYLANVFSPNGDGRNDIWKLPKEYLFPDLEIEIFNRWGALVWSAAGDKAARGWDGRTNNGKVLPIGTYWYVIKFNINSSEWKPLTGSVTIVK